MVGAEEGGRLSDGVLEAFAEQGCCEQVLCHNKIMAVDKGGLLGDTYPYPPTTSRRPEVAPNLEVVAFATTL